MLKQRTDDGLGIPIKQFAEFNKAYFYDDTIHLDTHQALDDPAKEYIT